MHAHPTRDGRAAAIRNPAGENRYRVKRLQDESRWLLPPKGLAKMSIFGIFASVSTQGWAARSIPFRLEN